MSMICRASFGVTDLDRACTFYDAVMAPLGVVRLWDSPTGAGNGRTVQGELRRRTQRSGAG